MTFCMCKISENVLKWLVIIRKINFTKYIFTEGKSGLRTAVSYISYTIIYISYILCTSQLNPWEGGGAGTCGDTAQEKNNK